MAVSAKGFKDIAPNTFNPIPGAVYLELDMAMS